MDKITGESLVFRTEHAAKPVDVSLIPFYKTYDQYYNVYWDYFTPEAWRDRQAAYEAEKKRINDLDARTVDYFRIGEMQPERDHNLAASENSYASEAFGRAGREARSGGWFEFEMKVDPSVANTFLCTYIGDDHNRGFDIFADRVKIATQELAGATNGTFFDLEYAVPPELVHGKQSMRIRIQAFPDKTAGRIFGCRVVK